MKLVILPLFCGSFWRWLCLFCPTRPCFGSWSSGLLHCWTGFWFMLFIFYFDIFNFYQCCIKKVKKNIILVVNRFLDIPILMSITPPRRSVKIRLHRNRRGKNPFLSVFTAVESGSGSGSRRRTSQMDPDQKTHLPHLVLTGHHVRVAGHHHQGPLGEGGPPQLYQPRWSQPDQGRDPNTFLYAPLYTFFYSSGYGFTAVVP